MLRKNFPVRKALRHSEAKSRAEAFRMRLETDPEAIKETKKYRRENK
jgi:hypothetical protein